MDLNESSLSIGMVSRYYSTTRDRKVPQSGGNISVIDSRGWDQIYFIRPVFWLVTVHVIEKYQ